jgi:integrase
MKRFNPLRPYPCVYWKHGAYWLVKRNKWERIGTTLDEASAEYVRRQSAPKGGMSKLIDDVYAAHAPKVSTATRYQYKAAAEILKRKLVQFSPEQVKQKHVVQLQESMSSHPNMANRTLTFLRLVFDYAVSRQLVDGNPCVGVKRLDEKSRKRRITMDEWQAIRAHAGPRLDAIMQVAYLTGQRIGDVLSIRRGQINDEGIAFKQQKTGKILTVGWRPELREAVEFALSLHHGVPALTLFVGVRGKPPNYRSVHEQWVRACKAAGIEDARPNDQRAQSLSDAKKQGINPTKLAGHTDARTTNDYLRDRESEVVEGPSLRQALDVARKR